MSRSPRVTRVTITHYEWTMRDIVRTPVLDQVYEPGAGCEMPGEIVAIETDLGVRGAAPGPASAAAAKYLLGRNPLERSGIWRDLKRAARAGLVGPPSGIDCALWDLAGKLYDAPIYELLGGGHRLALPCYASTFHGDDHGGLSSPDDFGEFAVQCRELGYPAFKIHGWVEGSIRREIETVLAVRDQVGPSMELMLDPAGAYATFADAIRVGRACDEAGYLWYEDPFRGGGFSVHAHAQLRTLIRTPLLVGEHLRGLEAKADAIQAGVADFIRAGWREDCGITGVMKIAALAEAHGVDVELHGGDLAHRQCMAALVNSNYYELGLVHPKTTTTVQPPLYEDPRWLDNLQAVDSNGCVAVPTGPGLGADLDWKWIRAHQTGEEIFVAD